MKYAAAVLPLFSALALGSPINREDAALAKRATDSITVNLDQCSGSPQHYGQGVLYGVQGTNTPPQNYLHELKINYISAGGAQSPTSGWASSRSAYNARFQTVVQDSQRIRQEGGVFIIKTSDLWGADATQPSNFPMPGDNGDWSSYDAFVQQIISDIKSNGMAINYNTQIEIWNEPDLGTVFWSRSQDQYLAMYARGTRAFRKAFPQGSGTFLPIVGPSTSSRPDPSNTWIKNYLSFLQNNKDAAPDVYNWHLEENNNNDPVYSTNYLRSILPNYGLSAGIGFQNNEYGTRVQQRPGFSAWHHARYEKVKYNGVRGNWASGSALRDNLADLLIKDSNGNYGTSGEYQEWKVYANLVGSPCATTEGSSLDSYGIASTAGKNATALVGNQGFTGTATVNFAKISSLGSGITRVRAVVQQIPYNNGAVVTGLTTVSNSLINVANNAVAVNINWGNADDAYQVTITAA